MILVIGAGISGLSTANNLKKDYIILEKKDNWGGLSTQYQSNGYWFDYSGHYFHFKDKNKIKKYLENFANFKQYQKKSKIHILNRYVPYPLQFHLAYLPRKTATIILEEIINSSEKKAKNLHDFLINNFGNRLFELFFHPFLQKYYQKNLKNIMANMDKGSIPVPNKESIIEGYHGKRFDSEGYNPVFYYPEPSLRAFINKFAQSIKSKIHLNETVEKIDLFKRKLYTQNRSYEYEYIINSMPLKELLKKTLQRDEFPNFNHLENISTLFINVVLKNRKKRFHWIYIPDKKISFYRVGFYPKQKFPVCYLEKTINPKEDIEYCYLFNETVFTLKKLGLIENRNEILHFDHQCIPVSYIIFNQQWRKIIPSVLEKLKNYRIYSIGRYGAWNYTSMSDDVKTAIKTAQEINQK